MKSLFCFFAFCLCTLGAKSAESAATSIASSELLCGPQATYIVLEFLQPSSLKYEEVVGSFYHTKYNGTSLNEIENFFHEKTKLHTHLKWCSEEDIYLQDASVISIVLLKQEPVSHLLVKRPVENGVLLIDPPSNLDIHKKDALDKTKRATLLVSTKPFAANTKENLLFGFGIITFIALAFYFFLIQRKKRT